MNLHAIASPLVAAVNPTVTIQIERSTGPTTNAAGKRTPTYASPVDVKAQVQPIQYNDIMLTNGMGLQGQRIAVYLPGEWNGIVRADAQGGDRVTLPDGTKWNVAVQSEQWEGASGWTKVICTRAGT